MSQIFEALRRAEDLESARKRMQGAAETGSMERRRVERRPIAALIRIYGHGQGLNPFFEENPILNASGTGAQLLELVVHL